MTDPAQPLKDKQREQVFCFGEQDVNGYQEIDIKFMFENRIEELEKEKQTKSKETDEEIEKIMKDNTVAYVKTRALINTEHDKLRKTIELIGVRIEENRRYLESLK